MSGWWNKQFFYFSQEELSISDVELLKKFQYFFITGGRKTDTTYKFGLLKSILDSLANIDFRAVDFRSDKINKVIIPIDLLAAKFAESYWNIVAVYDLQQARGSSAVVEKGINQTKERLRQKLNVKRDVSVPFEKIEPKIKNELINFIKRKVFLDRGRTYVLGALCGDFDGCLYEFDKSKEYFALSLRAYKFLLNHKTFIEECNYYWWAKFLENQNPKENTQSILKKLETSVPERKSLGIYKKLFAYYNYNTCFYCGKFLKPNEKSYHVDHFIPWSFIKEDKLWNLVPSCNTCNQKIKRAFLAPRDKIEIIEDRNDQLITSINKGILDENESQNLIVKAKNDFSLYRPKLIKDLYGYAESSGYKSLDIVKHL